MPHSWKKAWKHSLDEGGGFSTVTVFPDGHSVFNKWDYKNPERLDTDDCTLVWVCDSCHGMIAFDELEEVVPVEHIPEDFLPDPLTVAEKYLPSGLPCSYDHVPFQNSWGPGGNPDHPRTCEEATIWVNVRHVHNL